MNIFIQNTAVDHLKSSDLHLSGDKVDKEDEFSHTDRKDEDV